MELLFLLLLPLGVVLGGYVWSIYRGDQWYRITLKEFLVLVGIVVIVVGGGYGIGYFAFRAAATRDYEIWNGRIVTKAQERVSCEHSYPCNPHPCMCDEDGCSTCWDTCYEHSNDWDWAFYTSNAERVEIDRVDRRGSREPPRFAKIRIGDPTALAHNYTNYIKGNPWSILRRQGSADQFKNLIPPYPIAVHDYHYVNRFLSRGVSGFSEGVVALWNKDLMELNADLGRKKEVNIIVVAVDTDDSSFLHALEEVWLGGKKNDVVVILGVTRYPAIAWARIMSWTRAEELKISLSDLLEDVGSLEKREEILGAIRNETERLFVRTSMKEFEYLLAGIQPPFWVFVLLFVVGIAVSAGCTVYFYKEDPFDSRGGLW